MRPAFAIAAIAYGLQRAAEAMERAGTGDTGAA
jgi:hypothetical protein